MENLKELTANAVKAYPKANKDTKQLLEDLFGKITFSQSSNIVDRVSSWEDILEISGCDPQEFEPRSNETNDELAYRQAKLITEVYNDWQIQYNEGKVLDAGDTDQPKFYPWHKIVKDASKPSGFGLAFDGYGLWLTDSTVGVRLCFINPDHAIDAGKKFIPIYERLKIR